jgi:hypothetical protein
MNNFYSGSSQAEAGTLFQIKVFFQHKSVSSNVMKDFQHVWDLLQVFKK